MTITANKRTYSTQEVADMLGIGVKLAYRMIREGRIPSIKLGGRFIIPKHKFEEWLNREDQLYEIKKKKGGGEFI